VLKFVGVRYVLCWLVLIGATLYAEAQEARRLAVVSVAQVLGQQQLGGFAVSVPVKCTANGDLYVNFVGSHSDPGVSVLYDEGKHLSWFGLSRAADSFKDANLLDFAPGAGHDVVFLVSTNPSQGTPTEYFAVRMKPDGSSASIKLGVKPGFLLRQIALLGSESFVVSGFFIPQPDNPVPFVAMFDVNGQFIKKLDKPGDLTTKDVMESNKPSGKEPSQTPASWLDLSSLQTADDGAVYLTRKTSKGPVFLISPGGAVQRIVLAPPNREAKLSSVKINKGKIAAQYNLASISGQHRYSIAVVDVLTEQRQQLINYEGSQSTGVGMVCYREQTFEFLSQDVDGHLQVVRAIGN